MNERKLFLGIPLSPKSKTRIVQSVAKWGDLPVFAERPENLHVTVLFLGFVTDEHAVWIAEIAADICSEHEPFDLTFRTAVTVPDVGPVKIIHLVGDESEPLLRLQNALECELLGKKAEGKCFRPHVTLARVKRHEFASLSPDRLPIFPQDISISEPVMSVVLYESIGNGAKKQYLQMDEFPLG
ncbi:MAG TPA: RNA 2',3'-cyclic phosphodiesterase [Candidatus Fimivivens sp.]|nr:RNA 2',3'-cyclic phosphodiesterase [Candidatus Fimivivens sp.]